MKDKDIENKIIEGLRQEYDEAQSVFPRKVSWDELNNSEVAKMSNNVTLWSGFYLPKSRHDEIVKSLTKNTRWSWRWPRKSKIGEDGNLVSDPEWDEYQAAYEAKCKELESKQITRKEFNVWQNSMGEKYHMQRRNYDREKIDFNIWNYSPNSNFERYNEIKRAYDLVSSGWTAQAAAVNAVDEVTDETIEKEYNSRKELANKYEADKEFVSNFLDKDVIKEALESQRESRIETVERIVEALYRVWNEVLNKN